MDISCCDLPPRGTRQRLVFTVWKSAVQTERLAGRLGTPRLQACLDRSSPVSDCCGLVLGVEGSATLSGRVLQRRCAADCGCNSMGTDAAFRRSVKSPEFLALLAAKWQVTK